MGETNRPERPAPPAVHSAAVLTPPTGLPAVGAPTPSVPAQRAASEPATAPPAAAPPAVSSTAIRTCLCGHPEEMHEHYRAGDDCGACGPRSCGSFRDATDAADDAGPLRRVLRRLRA